MVGATTTTTATATSTSLAMTDSLSTPATAPAPAPAPAPTSLPISKKSIPQAAGRDGFIYRSSIPPPSKRPASPVKEFTPEACLFCNQLFPSQQASKQHMQVQHGLQVPLEKQLIVDWETLAKYLHLIIYEDHECIYCHTKRRSARAVQEHMMTKNHCFIDIDTEESEFRDFYDFEDDDDNDEDDDDEWSGAEELGSDAETDEESVPRIRDGRDDSVPVGGTDDDTTLRLPSGKIIANRKGGSGGTFKSQRLHNQRKAQPATSSRPSDDDTGRNGLSLTPQREPATAPESAGAGGASETQNSLIISKNAKGQDKFTVQRANLRESDRQAIAHLSLPRQRALLATAQQQEDKADRAQKSFGGKMDGLGNIKVSERFVNDVPGGKAHRNRFFAR